MKIQIREHITKEIEIEFPVYTKSTISYYYIKSETCTIDITDVDTSGKSIQVHDYIPDFAVKANESTKKEFNEAFKRVSNQLNEIVNS